MAGEYITIDAKDGGSFRGYLSLPPRGTGPGIVLCHEIFGVNATIRELADIYANEGYVVLAPDLYWREEPGLEFEYTSGDWQRAFALAQAFDFDTGLDDVQAALDVLRRRQEVQSETTASVTAQRATAALASAAKSHEDEEEDGPVGPQQPYIPGGTSVVGYSLGARLAYLAACRLEGVSCAVSYYATGIEDSLEEAANIRGRLVIHLPAHDKFVREDAQRQITHRFERSKNTEVYVYPHADRGFARRGTESYDRPAATIAHQRSMAALKREMGPYFNLSRLWDQHVRACFVDKDVEKVMSGMVPEPFVNYVPTQAGGVGYDKVKAFYSEYFIGKMPADVRAVPLSRTVGASQLVEESLLSFTHTSVIDWLLPGVAPTNRYVQLPMVTIVNYRGEKLQRLQCYWDQASVLVQIGKLETDQLPVSGSECARKMVNDDMPSNELLKRRAS